MSRSTPTRKVPLQAWLTEKEAKRVRAYCASHGVAIGEFLRDAALAALKKGPEKTNDSDQ